MDNMDDMAIYPHVPETKFTIAEFRGGMDKPTKAAQAMGGHAVCASGDHDQI